MKRSLALLGRASGQRSATRVSIPRTKRGIALLEVLVTVGLVALVIVLVGATLTSGATSAVTARLRAEQETELLGVMAAMRRQIITIAPSHATKSLVVGEIGREPSSDWIDMVTSSLMFTKGVGHAEWRIVHTPGQEPYLAYRETPWVGGEKLHDYAWIPYSRLVTGMQVRYWSNPQFVEGWKRDEVPKRIEVTLFYVDDGKTMSCSMQANPGIAGDEADVPATASPSPGASPNAESTTSPSASPTAVTTPTSTPTTRSTGGNEE